jgi:hypothetical protein
MVLFEWREKSDEELRRREWRECMYIYGEERKRYCIYGCLPGMDDTGAVDWRQDRIHGT